MLILSLKKTEYAHNKEKPGAYRNGACPGFDVIQDGS